MRRHDHSPDRFLFSRRSTALAAVGVFVAVLIGGCMATFGKLNGSEQAENLFIRHQYLNGHNYYYLGFESEPEAVLALDDRYTLTGKHWKSMSSKTHSLQEMVERMRFMGCRYKGYFLDEPDDWHRLSGYTILDPDEKAIGILYSCFDWLPVKVEEDRRVSIQFPEVNSIRRRVSHLFSD